MRNKSFIVSLIIIAASIAGLLLSVLLILEYFGVAPAAADIVCSRGNGVNACTIVSASRFAALRGLPLIGDLPVAVFGFIFYGFIAAVVILNGIRRNDDESPQLFFLILILSTFALIGDIALYLISMFIIKFVCPLCVMSYAATAVILVSSILMLKNNRNFQGESLTMSIKKYLKKHILNFALIAIALTAAGIGMGAGARVIAKVKEASTYEDRLNRAIRQYETAKETAISLTEAPALGKSPAQADFVMFFDFTCIHCMDEFFELEEIIKKYPDSMSVSFKYFPLNGDCGRLKKGRDDREAEGCMASAAAYCGHRQGKFAEYAKILFNNYHKKDIKFSAGTVMEAAKSAGMNTREFEQCFGSKKALEFVTSEYMETERLDIRSTPTLYLNGKRLVSGSRKKDILEGLVKYCMQRNK